MATPESTPEPSPPSPSQAPHPSGPPSAGAGFPDLARYERQIRCEFIGQDAQLKLLTSRVILVGCGGLGTVIAGTLVRAGIGFLRIIDPDIVELSNLQRQVLFDESDAAGAVPKAQAAARRLAAINTHTTLDPHVVRLQSTNAEELLADADVILDGTDNFAARFVINDVAVKHAIPWVHGACAGTTGMVLTLRPPSPPCLRCLWRDPPPRELCPTSETVGILAPTVNAVASLQVVEAFKLLLDHPDAAAGRLLEIEVWSGRIAPLVVSPPESCSPCPCCGERRFDTLP